MPKKSKGSKSKRMTLSKKYKIKKKVRALCRLQANTKCSCGAAVHVVMPSPVLVLPDTRQRACRPVSLTL